MADVPAPTPQFPYMTSTQTSKTGSSGAPWCFRGTRLMDTSKIHRHSWLDFCDARHIGWPGAGL